MIVKFSTVIGSKGINIPEMTSKSKGDIAYSMMDVESPVTEELIEELKKIDGVFRVRIVK